MRDKLLRLRATDENYLLGTVRTLTGMMFMMAGAMKLLVPMLADAWNGQLTQAGIPLLEFNLRFVPIVDFAVGAAMVSGFYSRLASLAVIIMMAVAIYVHSAVSDPALFPLQPSAPIIPAAVMAIAAWIVRSGSGAWSLDLLTDASHRKSHHGDIVEQSR